MKSSQVIRRSAALVALSLAVGGGYAAAQKKKPAAPAPAAQQAPAKTDGATSEMMSCPMLDGAPFADVTAENTADGAVIRLKAKKPADVQRIQQMAAMMTQHMTGEMMHRGMMRGGMGRGGMMQRGMMQGRPGSGPQPAQPKQPRAR